MLEKESTFACTLVISEAMRQNCTRRLRSDYAIMCHWNQHTSYDLIVEPYLTGAFLNRQAFGPQS